MYHAEARMTQAWVGLSRRPTGKRRCQYEATFPRAARVVGLMTSTSGNWFISSIRVDSDEALMSKVPAGVFEVTNLQTVGLHTPVGQHLLIEAERLKYQVVVRRLVIVRGVGCKTFYAKGVGGGAPAIAAQIVFPGG